MFVISRPQLKGLGRHLSMRILGAKVKFSVGHGKFNSPPLYAEIASSGRIPVTRVTSVTQFNAIFGTQKCCVLRCNSLSMVAFSCNYYSLVFKTRRKISVEVTGKRRNKGIGIEIPVTYLIYHKKPSKVKKLIKLIRDKEDRAEVN